MSLHAKGGWHLALTCCARNKDADQVDTSEAKPSQAVLNLYRVPIALQPQHAAAPPLRLWYVLICHNSS